MKYTPLLLFLISLFFIRCGSAETYAQDKKVEEKEHSPLSKLSEADQQKLMLAKSLKTCYLLKK